MSEWLCPKMSEIATIIIQEYNMRVGRELAKYFFSKRMIFGEECQQVIAETATEVARVAGITLGPMGRNVVIEDHKGMPRITKDGVTVVKHLQYEDRLKDAVCTLIKKSVNATNRFAGDGTTTSTLLIAQLVREGRRMVEAGAAVRQIREGLQIGRDIGVQFMRTASRAVTTQEQWQQVAMIATKGDRELSKLISEAVAEAALIKIQKGSLPNSYLQFYGGVKIGAGLAHPQFKNRGDKLELDYPLVLLDTVGITSVEQVVGVLQLAKKARKQLLVVSTAISDSVMSTLIYNLRKGIVEAYPLIIKEYGTQAETYFQQLSQTTGATIFDCYGPCALTEVGFAHLGRAARVEMDQFETSITGKVTKNRTSAVIYAGAATEAIALEVQDKLVDALNSVQTAKKHGVVAGGGVTYWRLADLLDLYDGPNASGVKLLARALRAPRTKLEAGRKGALSGKEWEGLNFRTGKYEDMFQTGVIDSQIVGESVLMDSVSLAQMLLEVRVCIVRSEPNRQSSEQVNLIQDSYKI